MIVLAPSNPVVSIGPILAVPGIRAAIAARRADRRGRQRHHRRRPARRHGRPADAGGGARGDGRGRRERLPRRAVGGWVIDERDRDLATRIERELGMRVAVTDTVMARRRAAERLAGLGLALGSADGTSSAASPDAR